VTEYPPPIYKYGKLEFNTPWEYAGAGIVSKYIEINASNLKQVTVYVFITLFPHCPTVALAICLSFMMAGDLDFQLLTKNATHA